MRNPLEGRRREIGMKIDRFSYLDPDRIAVAFIAERFNTQIDQFPMLFLPQTHLFVP